MGGRTRRNVVRTYTKARVRLSPQRPGARGATDAHRAAVGARDRPRAVSLAQHDPQPHPIDLPKARRLVARRSAGRGTRTWSAQRPLRGAVDPDALLPHTLLCDVKAVERASRSGHDQPADSGADDEDPEQLSLANLRSRETEACLPHRECRDHRVRPVEWPGVPDEPP